MKERNKFNFFFIEKLNNKRFYITYSAISIFLVSIFFALLVGNGVYGYGIDYYIAYSKGFEWNSPNANLLNYLGFKIATLKFNTFYLGVYLTSFILSVSTGFLIRENMKSKQKSSFYLTFLLIFIISIHTWPIIMSTSNAMRQGLTMSFFFLTIVATSNKNYFWVICFSFLAIFMHTSGLIVIIPVLFSIILLALFKFFSINKQSMVIINFFIGLSLLIISYLFISIVKGNDMPSRVISGDFRLPFFLISVGYIFLSFFYKILISNSFNLSLYYYSFVSTAFLMSGLNWQYERLGMMMIIPYILSFGSIVNLRTHSFFLLLSFGLLFLLTIYTGMYSLGLT